VGLTPISTPLAIEGLQLGQHTGLLSAYVSSNQGLPIPSSTVCRWPRSTPYQASQLIVLHPVIPAVSPQYFRVTDKPTNDSCTVRRNITCSNVATCKQNRLMSIASGILLCNYINSTVTVTVYYLVGMQETLAQVTWSRLTNYIQLYFTKKFFSFLPFQNAFSSMTPVFDLYHIISIFYVGLSHIILKLTWLDLRLYAEGMITNFYFHQIVAQKVLQIKQNKRT